MKKGLSFVLLLLFGLTTAMMFQNCGDGATANSSNNDNQLEVIPNGELDETSDGEGDGGGDGDSDSDGGGDGADGEFTFDLGKGDNIFYLRGGGIDLSLASSRISAMNYYTVQESRTYGQQGVAANSLTVNYCEDSALPHCAHKNDVPCSGFGCFDTQRPVLCAWQKRMSDAEIGTTFSALNSITFGLRNQGDADEAPQDCSNPLLSFFKQNSSLDIGLGAKGCGPVGQYYATQNSGAPIQTILNNDIERVYSLADATPSYCNNFSAYAWDTTKLSIRTQNAVVAPGDEVYIYELEYASQKVNIRFQEGGSGWRCATNVHVQPAELSAFFPEGGLEYLVELNQMPGAVSPPSQITYEDPMDGGAVWHFYLSRSSGNPSLKPSQAQAISSMVSLLVNRAKDTNMAGNCP